ncbi:NlpC/P60 family protein [Brevibacillus dissolubilis]|uniref:NlpC/P60 family protein n=1 Tax=Brevibacillus dissolubilis TaxID=1844116 RepID=UPI001115BAFE|nr:NlpC/P60 family protein [Brevibacillus dissolubilis]
MSKRKAVLTAVTSVLLGAAFVTSPVVASTTTWTTDSALTNYNKYLSNYQSDELVKVNQYRQAYSSIKGSLADQIMERAFWYMENGYAVYGHGWNSYPEEGIIDCSSYTRLVFGDFGYNMTNASVEYDNVGYKITGVSSAYENGAWKLKGTENLRPGDILTWYAVNSSGQKYISHVAIFIGMLNGQPAVIGTTESNATTLGIVNDFRYWYGSNFHSAQRVLPKEAWTAGKVIPGHEAKAPVIPKSYVLKPQKSITMPVIQNTGAAALTDGKTYITPNSGYVGVLSQPNTSSTRLGSLHIGEYAPIIRKYNSYYYEIQYAGKTGYVTASSTYTHTEPNNLGQTWTGGLTVTTDPSIPGGTPISTSTSTGTTQPPIVTGQYVMTNNGWVSYFSGPSLSSTQLGKLYLGQKAPYIRKYNNYYYEIWMNGRLAYITASSVYTKVVSE